jgi:hypothetical protein
MQGCRVASRTDDDNQTQDLFECGGGPRNGLCGNSDESQAERSKPLNREQRKNLWINPLLTQLKLVRRDEESSNPNSTWKLIEETHLTERVGRLAAEINETAGYHLLETLFYLPPQKSVLSVRFDRNRAKHSLELVIPDKQIWLKFTTTKHVSFGWERYFASDPTSNSSSTVWEQIVQPGEVLDEHIQGWLTYLLSELSKEFRPDVLESAAPEAQPDLSEILRKASA